MVAGHTKFSCDRMFGWISRLLKNMSLHNLSQISKMIKKKLKSHRSHDVKVLKAKNCLNFKKHFGMNIATVPHITLISSVHDKKRRTKNVKIEVKKKKHLIVGRISS